MSDAQYAFSLTTFSPSGKLLQIEYALQAVSGGATSLGIKAKDGVVIASEKKLHPLVKEETVHKIANITDNIGMVYSGIGPDFRVLVRKARKKAQAYYRYYKEQISVNRLVREVAAIMQEYTQSGGVRPFGVSLMIAGWDDAGPQLFQVDPSGAYFPWKASAIGKGMIQAKGFLEKRYQEDMETDEAIHRALLTLKEGFDGQLTNQNVEVAIIREDRTFQILTPLQIKDYLEDEED